MGTICNVEEKKQKALFKSLIKKINKELEISFVKDPNKNKKIQILSKYQDGTITPNVIDDIFGQNHSKIKKKLKLIFDKVHTGFIQRMRAAETDKTKLKTYINMYRIYRSDLLALIKLNLNFKKTLLGNLDTLLYLRNGK